MDLLIVKQKPVMLVGSAGSGKTVSVAAKLNSLPDSYAITNVPFNFYTTSGENYDFFLMLLLGFFLFTIVCSIDASNCNQKLFYHQK